MPVIRVTEQVLRELQKKATDLGLLFPTPNETIESILGLKGDQKKGTGKGPSANAVEFEFRDNDRRYGRFYLRGLRGDRHILPGLKHNFALVTDMGEFSAHLASAPKGTPAGDPDAGKRIRGRLRPWFESHPELKAGDTLRIEALEPANRYRLSVVSAGV